MLRLSDILRDPSPATGSTINNILAESHDCRGLGVYESDGPAAL